MPIRAHLRFFYPIDWPQLSAVIRFDRAKGRCEGCGRPHGKTVRHLGDGRWYDEERAGWRNGQGRPVKLTMVPDQAATTTVYIATAHLDHDPGNSSPRNLKALCQRCHMLHDREEHRRQRWLTLRMRKAIGDLFSGPYR